MTTSLKLKATLDANDLTLRNDNSGNLEIVKNTDVIGGISSAGWDIKGTTTNDSAATGYVGEYVESVVGLTNAPATGQYGDLTSLSSLQLTAGDWDLSANVVANANGATTTGTFIIGISTTSGNSSSGLVAGSNQMYMRVPTSTESSSATIAGYRVSIASGTTHYLKMFAQFSAGTPQFAGRISARRVR